MKPLNVISAKKKGDLGCEFHRVDHIVSSDTRGIPSRGQFKTSSLICGYINQKK